MDEKVKIAELEHLENHLEQLLEDPQTPLNAKLFDDVELQLTGMSGSRYCLGHAQFIVCISAFWWNRTRYIELYE
jgi:hypothetical protein